MDQAGLIRQGKRRVIPAAVKIVQLAEVPGGVVSGAVEIHVIRPAAGKRRARKRDGHVIELGADAGDGDVLVDDDGVGVGQSSIGFPVDALVFRRRDGGVKINRRVPAGAVHAVREMQESRRDTRVPPGFHQGILSVIESRFWLTRLTFPLCHHRLLEKTRRIAILFVAFSAKINHPFGVRFHVKGTVVRLQSAVIPHPTWFFTFGLYLHLTSILDFDPDYLFSFQYVKEHIRIPAHETGEKIS